MIFGHTLVNIYPASIDMAIQPFVRYLNPESNTMRIAMILSPFRCSELIAEVHRPVRIVPRTSREVVGIESIV